MKKNKALIFVCIILVVAMVMAMAAGCSNKGKIGTTIDGNQNSTTISISNADRGQLFTVVAADGVTNIDGKVNVVAVASGEKVNISIAKAENTDGKNVFTVFPPSGYYTMGTIYKITIDKSLSFGGYAENVKSIVFTITQDAFSGIKFVDGLITFDATQVERIGEEKFEPKGEGQQNEISGSLKIQTSGVEVNPGDVIMVEDKVSGLVEAFKVESAGKTEMNAVTFVNYVKPQINEVYEEFTVSENKELDENSNVDFTYEETEEALENSELAMAALEIFKTKPEFDLKINKVEGGAINATITMTIPGVVKIDDFSTDLVVKVNALMNADAIINADMEGNAVDCGVIANVYNIIDTEVTISGGYSYSSVTNLTELIEKTAQMQDEANQEGGVAVPMFTWTIPVGGGAVNVTYQCDLVFKFSFAGRLGVNANAEFNYMVGATYDKELGVSTYAEELDGSGLKNVDIDIEGSAKVKVGLRNSLSLDILAGVVSLGIQAELGNFNGLYGYATTGNLVGVENIEDVAVSGAIYFEGGFYYDVDLALAISIGSIANINKNIDIVAGEIVLYSAGEPTVVTAIDGAEFELTAITTELPEFNATAYDLKAMSEFDTKVSMKDAEVYESDFLRVANGTVTILKEGLIDETVTLRYPTNYGVIEVPVRFTYDGSVVFDKSEFNYDKAGADRKNDLVVSMRGTEVDKITSADQVTVSAKNATFDLASKKVTIPYKTLADMAVGQNVVAINVNGFEAYLTINVTGVATVENFAYGNDVYEIFTSDQIKDFVQSGNDFVGKTLRLTNDIDMGGAVIAPKAVFAGIFDGQGYTISNFTVEGMVDNSVAFIATNRGTISNLTLEGNVNANINAKTDNDYFVAGVVAKNLGNGSVNNVNFNGKITMNSTSLNAFVTIKVMTLVAEGNAANGGNANVEIEAVSQFDIANVTIKVDSKASSIVTKCANAAVEDGALVKFERI